MCDVFALHKEVGSVCRVVLSFLISVTPAELQHRTVWAMVNQFLLPFVCADNRAKLGRSIGRGTWSRAVLMMGPCESGGLLWRCITTVQRNKSGSGFGPLKLLVLFMATRVVSTWRDISYRYPFVCNPHASDELIVGGPTQKTNRSCTCWPACHNVQRIVNFPQ